VLVRIALGRAARKIVNKETFKQLVCAKGEFARPDRALHPTSGAR
jgi:hypothetical protein